MLLYIVLIAGLYLGFFKWWGGGQANTCQSHTVNFSGGGGGGRAENIQQKRIIILPSPLHVYAALLVVQLTLGDCRDS